MKVKEVYQFYDESLKPLYSETEARDNSLPIEVLFEIHSAFDHLKRFYVTGEDEGACCRKAYGHLVRACLDMYKIKLKDFNASIEKFQATIDPEVIRLVDNGKFFPELVKDRSGIIKFGKEARQAESQEDKEAAFGKWAEVANKIDIFEEKYFNSEQIHWAITRHKKKRLKDALLGGVKTSVLLLIGALLGALLGAFVDKSTIIQIWAKVSPGVSASAYSSGTNAGNANRVK